MLRPATDADLDLIREWRNQDANRTSSNYSHVISPAEHAAWWARTTNDPTRRILIFVHEGTPCGVANFFDLDESDRSGSWGFFLDSEGAYGKDLGAWISLMREGVAYAFTDLRLRTLRGEVLEGNPSVRAMNRRLGFVEAPPEEREVDGRRFTVYPLRMTADTRRG
jgi:RimJ/RimL family protein N-acetyltransferase